MPLTVGGCLLILYEIHNIIELYTLKQCFILQSVRRSRHFVGERAPQEHTEFGRVLRPGEAGQAGRLQRDRLVAALPQV